ncbi:MAG TPA: glycosyltransferase family 1 protein [Thermomicrobiales bacterium]|jgi:glycosyltransferase involved in cell wall biosynthesis|nr:glycosyltransferase family 1 protein [Thermomicrobiales bacterium]
MRVGINARLIGTDASFRRAGVSRYIENLVRHLPGQLGSDDELMVAGGPRSTPAGIADRWVGHPVGRIAWEQTALPIRARRDGWDLLHSPVNVTSLLRTVPAVVTVHDLAFMSAGATMPAARRRYLAAMTHRSVRTAARVIAVSESTRDELARWFDVLPDRVAVTPLAPEPHFHPAGSDELADFRIRSGIDRPFILSVGTREPRKNGPALVRAWASIAASIPHDLVLVGPAGWLGGELDQALADLTDGLRERVRLTGFVDDADLPRWYAAAAAFAYPALYEGFGLPVIEAMACGVPVLTSTTSSLPEVAGDAALLVPPGEVDAIAAGLQRLVTDSALAGDLRSRGLVRAATFSWERTARQTVAAYRAALECGPGET